MNRNLGSVLINRSFMKYSYRISESFSVTPVTSSRSPVRNKILVIFFRFSIFFFGGGRGEKNSVGREDDITQIALPAPSPQSLVIMYKTVQVRLGEKKFP